MGLNLPNPTIKSIVITPVSSKATEDHKILIDYKTKLTVTIKDTSPAGTTKYEWLNIPDFTKYLKIVACQIYYKDNMANVEEVVAIETRTPSTRNRKTHPNLEGDIEGWSPEIYASLGPSHKYSEKIRRVLQSEIAAFTGEDDAVSVPVENESYKSDEFSRFYVSPVGHPGFLGAQVEFQEVSLEQARSPRRTNPTFAATIDSSFDIDFPFEFDLKDIEVDESTGIPLDNLTHLIFLDFDFYQALEDAGVKQLINSTNYRRKQERTFGENLSSRSKIIRSIRAGSKARTLSYYSFVDGTPFQGTPVLRAEDGLLYESVTPELRATARRIIERKVQNDKVHYLNPFAVTSYPSYDQMKEQIKTLTGQLDAIRVDAVEYKKESYSATRAPLFTSSTSVIDTGVCVLNMNIEESREISDEKRYSPIKMYASDEGVLTVTMQLDYDKLFMQNSKHYQLYRNSPNRSAVLIDLVQDLKVYEQSVEYSRPKINHRENVVVRKPEVRSYLDPASYVYRLDGTVATITFTPDIEGRQVFESCVYGCEISLHDPIAERVSGLVLQIKRGMACMEDFYSHAMVPSFGLTNESKTSLYGLGNKVVFSEPTEFVGSVDYQTGLYTEEFSSRFDDDVRRLVAPVTVQAYHRELTEGGSIHQAILNYTSLKNSIYPGNVPENLTQDLLSNLAVTPSNSPKLLEIMINEMRALLTTLNKIFGDFAMDLSTTDLKKIKKTIIKYEKEFTSRPILKSDEGLLFYDANNILQSIPSGPPLADEQEWWA